MHHNAFHRERHASEQPRTCLTAVMMFLASRSSGGNLGSAPHAGHSCCRAKVKATYLLSGWTSQEPRRHVVHLVAPEQLSMARQALQPVTSMHVYSVQPSAPKVRGC